MPSVPDKASEPDRDQQVCRYDPDLSDRYHNHGVEVVKENSAI